MEQITLSEPWKKVVWITSTVCNYACSYCAPNLHDGKFRWPADYKNVVKMINIFRNNQNLMLDMSGGEPTLWPEFQQFCKEIVSSSSMKTSIQFTSNGARTERYWKSFNAPVDTLGFSFHPEFASEAHYFKILKVLHERYNVKVFLMTPPGTLDRIKEFFYNLKNSDLMVDVVIKLIKDNQNGGLIEGYSNEYYDFATNRFWKSRIQPIDTAHSLYNGEKFIPQNLINTKKDTFTGWLCNVGIDRLSIEPNGDIYGSTCYITTPYGNIHDLENVKLPTEPIICTKKFCGCGADIAIGKYKI